MNNQTTKTTVATSKSTQTPNTTTPTQGNWNRKELGVLWSRKKQSSGEKYLTGTLNLKAVGFDRDVPIVIFSNKNKTQERHPDLRIYLSEKPTATAAQVAPAVAVAAPDPAPTPLVPDDLI